MERLLWHSHLLLLKSKNAALRLAACLDMLQKARASGGSLLIDGYDGTHLSADDLVESVQGVGATKFTVDNKLATDKKLSKSCVKKSSVK